MRRFFLSVVVVLLSIVAAFAHDPQKFSPEKFQADLEQFITKEASLTPEEAAKFFPLYREMQHKQRVVWQKMKDLGRNKPAEEAACKLAVQKRDELELEQKVILQTYHNKFFKVIRKLCFSVFTIISILQFKKISVFIIEGFSFSISF